MNWYPESFVVRLLVSVVIVILATNLGLFIRANFIAHVPFVFDIVKGLLIPAALGVVAALFWKPKN